MTGKVNEKIMKLNKLNRLNNLRFACLTCLFLLNGMLLFAQETSLKLTIDTAKLLIGDQTTFRISLSHKPGIRVEWPVLHDTLIKGMEVLKMFPVDTVAMSMQLVSQQQKYLVTSFDSGHHSIPSQKIILHDGPVADTLVTDSLAFDVFTIPVDTSKAIFDIKAPYGAPLTFREILPWIGILMAMMLLFFLSVYIMRRIRKNKPIIPVRRFEEPPHVIALRELDRLKEQKLWQNGMIKEYYTRLTDIVRVYIEHRFLVPAMEQTSDEILGSISGFLVDEEATYAALTDLLTLADLVKFARALPLPDENESNILNAYLFVNNTLRETGTLKETSESSGPPENIEKEAGHE